MMRNSTETLRSGRTVGYLWLVAGVLMLLPSVFSAGRQAAVGAGVMFVIFGIVFLSRERKQS